MYHKYYKYILGLSISMFLLSLIIFYVYLYIQFNDTLAFYTIDYRIHTWDEVVYYFNRITSFIELGHLNYHDGIDSNFSKLDLNIFPFLFNSLIYYVLGFEFFPIGINLVLGILLLYLFYYIFNRIFALNIYFSISASLLMLITFGYGPTTYIMLKPLFIDLNNQWFLPPIARQESPSTVLFILLTYFIFLYNFVCKEKKVFFLPLIIFSLINNFSYPYYILYTFNVLSFALIYVYFFEKKYFKTLFIATIINHIFFLAWYLLGKFNMSHDSDFIYTLIFDRSVDIKTLVINGIFILIHIIHINYQKAEQKKLSKILIVMYLAGICSYHFNVILGYKIENWHIDIYVLKPLQWISIIFFTLQIQFVRKYVVYIILFISTLFLIANNNYANSYILTKNKDITTQISMYSSYKKIEPFVKGKLVLTLDPLFIMAGRTISNHYNYITFSGREIRRNVEQNLDNYIRASIIHKIDKNQSLDHINKIDFTFIKGHKNYEPFKYIIFLNDQIDGIYQSLNDYGSNIMEKDLKKIIYDRYDYLSEEKKMYNGFLLLNKHQFKKDNMFDSLEIVYEDNNIVLYEMVSK